MLELVLGTAGTGKTGLVLARMKARAAAARKSMLLVPEQFSSSAESMVYAAPVSYTHLEAAGSAF